MTDMLADLTYKKLETRRAKLQLTIMFKIVQGLVSIVAAKYVTPASPGHSKKLREDISLQEQ